jgi:hypothetical protein
MIKKRFVPVAVTIAVLVVVLSIVMVSTHRYFSSPLADPTVIVQQIRNLQHLITRESHYRDVVYFSETPRILGIPVSQREILFHVTIVVTAGVDLSLGVQVHPVRGSSNTVNLILPSAQIMSVDMQEHTIHQHFVHDPRGRLDWTEVSRGVLEARERNRTDAVRRGILYEAEKHTEQLVRRSLAIAEIAVTEVVFE